MHDWETREPVDNKAIQELLDELNTKYPSSKWVVKSTNFLQGRLWWKKKVKLYTLYSRIMGGEYQVINFYRDGTDWSINTYVPAELIVAFLYGLINGNINVRMVVGDN